MSHIGIPTCRNSYIHKQKPGMRNFMRKLRMPGVRQTTPRTPLSIDPSLHTFDCLRRRSSRPPRARGADGCCCCNAAPRSCRRGHPPRLAKSYQGMYRVESTDLVVTVGDGVRFNFVAARAVARRDPELLSAIASPRPRRWWMPIMVDTCVAARRRRTVAAVQSAHRVDVVTPEARRDAWSEARARRCHPSWSR